MASASPRCGLLEAVDAIPLLIWPVRATIFVPPSSLDYQPILHTNDKNAPLTSPWSPIFERGSASLMLRREVRR